MKLIVISLSYGNNYESYVMKGSRGHHIYPWSVRGPMLLMGTCASRWLDWLAPQRQENQMFLTDRGRSTWLACCYGFTVRLPFAFLHYSVIKVAISFPKGEAFEIVESIEGLLHIKMPVCCLYSLGQYIKMSS